MWVYVGVLKTRQLLVLLADQQTRVFNQVKHRPRTVDGQTWAHVIHRQHEVPERSFRC